MRIQTNTHFFYIKIIKFEIKTAMTASIATVTSERFVSDATTATTVPKPAVKTLPVTKNIDGNVIAVNTAYGI